MENGVDRYQVIFCADLIDENARQARDDLFICPPHAARVAHIREAAETIGTCENPVDHGIRRSRPVFCDPRIYPIEVVIGGLSDDDFMRADARSALAPLQGG